MANDPVIIAHRSWSGFCQEDASVTAFGRKQSHGAATLNTNATPVPQQRRQHSRSRGKSASFGISSKAIFNLKVKEEAEMSRNCLFIVIGRKMMAISAWKL